MSEPDNHLLVAADVARGALSKLASWLVAAIVTVALTAPLAAPIGIVALGGRSDTAFQATVAPDRLDPTATRLGARKVTTR